MRDPEQRRKLAVIYRKASDIAKAIYQARGRPAHMTEEQYQRMMSSSAYLWEHMALLCRFNPTRFAHLTYSLAGRKRVCAHHLFH